MAEKANIMKVLILFLATFLTLSAYSQSKKKQIEILTNRVDSIYSVLRNERSVNSVELSNLTAKIKELENQNSSLSGNVSNLNNDLQACKTERRANQVEITSLKIQIESLQNRVDSLQMSKKMPFIRGQSIYCANEGRYLSTGIFDFSDIPQVLTDSLVVTDKNGLVYSFYFFTPISEDLNLQCPYEFGFVVYDYKGTEIYKTFSPGGNYYGGYLEFDLGYRKRRLMGIGDSGCGSGGSIVYCDLDVNDGKINIINSIYASTGGFETTIFLPKKNAYVNLKRINAESHWEGDSRYELTFYSLINDQFLSRKSTKYIYPHFGELGEGELSEMMEKREPNIFKL